MNIKIIILNLAWPLTLLLAWLAGEIGYRWMKLPRISIYAVVGFILAQSQVGLLPHAPSNTLLLLANIAFGLILFEAGYYINLHWLRTNPWIGITSLVETTLTFGAVYALAYGFGLPAITAFLLATLAMATSPATVVRIVHEQRSAGQVTERALHLSVLNCVLAVLVFKMVIGLSIFKVSDSLGSSAYNNLLVLLISLALGASFGVIIPMLLRAIHRTHQDCTLVFALSVIFLVALTHNLKLSPIIATLTFGLVTRHRRIILNPSQRGFGVLGDLLAILLFVFIATTLEWQKVYAGILLGLSLIVVRFLAKTIGISLFARFSGITCRKGLLVSLAITPISAFVILVLEQTRYLGINLFDQLAPLAAIALIMEIFGPIFVQRALYLANEVPSVKEPSYVDRAV
ncbi:MAG TPA: cation:proton antiporter [Gammaproteobacteria bacterium]|nr:cation:proton antiporter [Gammaproteobacteria bacterium]